MRTKIRFKKIMSVFLTGVMSLSLCIGTVMTAFAADEPLPNGTPENPAGAAITKVFERPQGTVMPTVTFTFNIEKVSVDADTSAAVIATMPSLTGNITMNAASISTVVADKEVVTMHTGNLLAGATWPHAGEYVYKVTEAASGYTILDPAKETLTYSQAEYELHVYIAEADDGTLYVKSAGVVIVKDQNGGSTGAGEKVDPSVPDTAGEGNNFKFVNRYTKITGGGEGPDPDMQSVAISKVVAGDLASKTKYFPFEVTITNNSLITTASYKAYICTLDAGAYTKVSAAEADNQYDASTDYVTFIAGAMKEIRLKHGQYLVFMDCPQGTVYSANEKAVPGYKAAVHIVTGGAAIVDSDLTNSTANTPLSTKDRIITAGGANSADFTNTYASTVPTGIILSNLPFIAMILVAIGACTAFIVNKRRKMIR